LLEQLLPESVLGYRSPAGRLAQRVRQVFG
jgi:hypothetical protein